MAADGAHGLKPGDPDKVEIIRWIFDQYANRGRSICWIAGELNRQGKPGPFGGRWYIKTVALILRKRAYRGDFTYNVKPSGNSIGLTTRVRLSRPPRRRATASDSPRPDLTRRLSIPRCSTRHSGNSKSLRRIATDGNAWISVDGHTDVRSLWQPHDRHCA